MLELIIGFFAIIFLTGLLSMVLLFGIAPFIIIKNPDDEAGETVKGGVDETAY